MLTLEKYKTKASRHECPACGRRNVFARYVDESGNYIDKDVGRCNRENKCGYHLTPKEYFEARGSTWTPRPTHTKPPSKPVPKPLIEIPRSCFEATRKGIEQNAFVRFLLNRYDREQVLRVCEQYQLGDFKRFTCYWRIDHQGRVWTAKLIKYDAATGKRRKDIDYSFDWMHSLLERRGQREENTAYRRVLFGAHLLTDDSAPVAIVEAEKTAVIAALELPDFLWLACGGRTQISAEKIQAFGKRRVMLFPDGDSFAYWSKLADEARAQGANVIVSDLLEKELTDEQKADGWDLADYLLAPEPIAAQTEVAVFASKPLVKPAIAPVATNPTNDYAALFAGHCKRCGDHLQPDGACNLCKQPLPF